ncbi:MAG: D-alanyl-D-alanine carboxypeptidase [Synechococcales cyanobacterium]
MQMSPPGGQGTIEGRVLWWTGMKTVMAAAILTWGLGLGIPVQAQGMTFQSQMETYVSGLAQSGWSRSGQGVWLQTNQEALAAVQGTTPLSAASVTKMATTLVALQTWGPDHRFVTAVGQRGSLSNGILQGDLIIQGTGDPFFVWEDAFALGNALNQLGIRQVTGNLVVNNAFYMNFLRDPARSGGLLRQGLNGSLWTTEARSQFQTLPPGTPAPQVVIQGQVVVGTATPDRWLIRHQSYPVAELLKRMNLWSNNVMADMLADLLGGGAVLSQQAAAATGVTPAEMQLINGSGLGVANRISPRAAANLFIATQQLLATYQMTLGDVVAIIGSDPGVLEKRLLPPLALAKSGTLNAVSTLAGVLPTENQGLIWFAIMNQGTDLLGFRTQQGQVLNRLQQQAGIPRELPPELRPTPARASLKPQTDLLVQP